MKLKRVVASVGVGIALGLSAFLIAPSGWEALRKELLVSDHGSEAGSVLMDGLMTIQKKDCPRLKGIRFRYWMHGKIGGVYDSAAARLLAEGEKNCLSPK